MGLCLWFDGYDTNTSVHFVYILFINMFFFFKSNYKDYRFLIPFMFFYIIQGMSSPSPCSSLLCKLFSHLTSTYIDKQDIILIFTCYYYICLRITIFSTLIILRLNEMDAGQRSIGFGRRRQQKGFSLFLTLWRSSVQHFGFTTQHRRKMSSSSSPSTPLDAS